MTELQAELEEGEWDEERFEGVMRRFVEGDVDEDDVGRANYK